MKWSAFFVVFLLAFATGYMTLDTGVISDDYVLIEASSNTPYSALFTSNWLGVKGQGGFYRPLSLLSFKLDNALHGGSPRGYHWTNLWLHVLAALLVFLLVFRLQNDTSTAFLTASIFAVHPVHIEAISWISGRTDLLSAVFYLLCLNLFLTIDPRESKGCLTAILALFCAICSMMSKEMGFTLPMMIIFVDRFDRPRDAWWQRSRSQHYASYFVVLTGVLVLRYLAVGQFLGGYGSEHLQISRIFTYLSIYLNFLLEPLGLQMGNDMPVHVVFTLSMLLLSCVGLFNEKCRHAMGFWWISLVPVLTLCRSQYLYLPSIGAFWVIGVIVRNGKHETRSSTGDIARVILSGALILGLLFHFNYKQQHWNHSGWVASAVKDVIQTIHPTLPANSRVVLLNPPQNNNLKMGVFQNGFAEAVRNWYNDDSLDGIRVRHPENFTDIRPDTDIVFDCNGAEIRDVTDIWSKQSEITVVIPHTSEVILNNDRRYHRLDFDPVESDSLAMFTQLSHGCDLAQGATVAEITLFFSDDSQQVVTLDAGRDTAEWAIDRDDLKNKCSHLRASVAASTIKGDAPEPPTYSHLYKASWNFGEVKQLLGLNIRLLLGKDGQSGTRPELVIRGVNCLRRNN